MKKLRYYTHASRSICWNSEKCLHAAKCLKSIPPIIDKPGIFSIPVNEAQFDILLSQSRFCPGGALTLVSPTDDRK